jgi:ATP-dependent protease HslVU (ClpYQ) peptidase subunit
MTVSRCRYRQNGKTVVMAADSQTTSGFERLHLSRTKLWIDGQYLIGASGTLRDAQVIQHHVRLPKYRPDEHTDIEQFMVTEVSTSYPQRRRRTRSRAN